MRRFQGWRADIEPSQPVSRLAEITTDVASVATVTFETQQGVDIDDGGFVEAETRVQEASRVRVFPARRQGFAFNIPGGITIVRAQGFAKPYRVWVMVAPGIVTTENIGYVVRLSPTGTEAVEAPALARTVTLLCVVGAVSVTVPLGAYALTAGQSLTLPAYGFVSVTETAGAAALVSATWEVTA